MSRCGIVIGCLIAFFLVGCKSTGDTIAKSAKKQYDKTQPLERLAFGSCNKHDSEQPLWGAIIEKDPDVWLWLGDIIYGDTESRSRLQKYYSLQKKRPGYQQLLNTGCSVIGIWDDHDYGVNDGDKSYPIKEASRDLLFDFLDVPEDDESRKREGAYSSHTYGIGENKVKVILLDGRYFRDALVADKKTKQRYQKNAGGKLLGEEQWEWLENELRNSDAAVHLMGCGIQVIPEEHYFEKWANFPSERERLFDLLLEAKVKAPILLSGDRHIGEFSKIERDGFSEPIYEMTSSGLTHYYSGMKSPEVNKYREGKLVADYNYGLIEFEWEKETVGVHMQLLGLDNILHEEVQLQFDR
ncbi:alkaline phosphatase family protein [Chitinophagales bacterium]|nr:alkaline phosphatase family protein [Chitinophagales bacterium]